ncbi:hypothetical protein O9992_27115 [Vibrio lentus]|nr:hypothetical protein [Vibrio lentus]
MSSIVRTHPSTMEISGYTVADHPHQPKFLDTTNSVLTMPSCCHSSTSVKPSDSIYILNRDSPTISIKKAAVKNCGLPQLNELGNRRPFETDLPFSKV